MITIQRKIFWKRSLWRTTAESILIEKAISLLRVILRMIFMT